MVTQTEENYLKALFHLTLEIKDKQEAGTNEVAETLEVSPATVNNMLKRLKEKDLVSYEKYGKIRLTEKGKSLAINVVRKHRLWETFLYEKLNFTWDEVHEVAEQLEHIKSPKLIEELEAFLEYPKIDPHGDPIPNAKGEINFVSHQTLAEVNIDKTYHLVAVKNNTASFLKYITELGIELKTKIKVINRQEFDESIEIEVNGKHLFLSKKVSKNLFVI